ncbi:MAG: DUF551 domain-containing protein [Eubacteriales bacterium]|nr:DUF551 domain-containing protein [Eubacteriales bacterium]
MSRLIDADAFKEWLEKYASHQLMENKHVFQAIDAQPTVTDANVGSKWIPCSERLPEEESGVLVLTKTKKGFQNIDKGFLLDGRFVHRGTAEVTHWMPLPELPEEE